LSILLGVADETRQETSNWLSLLPASLCSQQTQQSTLITWWTQQQHHWAAYFFTSRSI